jgi:hypothetical protein
MLPAFAAAEAPAIPAPASKKAQELFVFGNGVVCVMAPCPSFTVITADGAKLPVANVVLPKGAGAQAQQALFQGGLVVEGVVEQGLWAPHGTGTVVRASAIIDEAQDYLLFRNGIVCITAPCPSISAVGRNGDVVHIAGVDLLAVGGDAELHRQILASEMVVKGIVKHGSSAPFAPGETLLVSKISGAIQTLQVKSSGIVCVVAPCPVWSVTNAAGVEQKAARVDLTALRLPGEDAQVAALGSLAKGASVRGFLAAGPWSPFGTGAVLFVTGILE